MSTGVTTVKLVSAKLYKSEDGKVYRKLTGAEAVKCANPFRGLVGEGDKAKPGWYEEVAQPAPNEQPAQ